MPTWPTTTVPTGNLDAGSDQPSLARADIKTMADVVNSLVAYGTPSGGGVSTAYVWGGGNVNISTLYVNDITNSIDSGLITTNTSSDYFTFNATGNYRIKAYGSYNRGTGTNVTIYLRNATTFTNELFIGQALNFAYSDIRQNVRVYWQTLTVTSTSHQYQYVYTNDGTTTEVRNHDGWMLEIIAA